MSEYSAPLRDMNFVIEEWLQAPNAWQQSQLFTDLDIELASQVLEEAAKFATGELAPLNAIGDREGCRWIDGEVRTPTGFAAAYAQYVEGGWPALACAAEDGGQGLPQLLNAALHEMLFSANHAWAMYTGIAHGAYECLRAHGSEELRARYLEQIVSGECLPTMCLTEPQAGSDVGLVRTRADRQSDGTYTLTGNKIFISGAEHDFTQNILHLVLARVPGAPAGNRGISLFLVPKYYSGAQGDEQNGIRCVGIEHKMGIHGSPTCSIAFEGAKGWLVGQEDAGLNAMFVMMNSARLHVGLQGLGHAQMALQEATGYAAERTQMRAPRRPQGVPAAPVDPIEYHPAMRRKLLELRAYTEGMRAIGYWAAHLLDMAEDASGSERHRLEQQASLLTPIIKAFFSEQGFRLASEALQVHGGYGYVQDYSIEQTLRDSRVVMLYEGTNEIQANDLLLRKVLGDKHNAFGNLVELILNEAQQDAHNVSGYGAVLEVLCAELREVVSSLHDSKDPEQPYRIATDFLRLMGLILLGYAWARTWRISFERAEPFYQVKVETAQFYFDYVLPEADLRIKIIRKAAALPFKRRG